MSRRLLLCVTLLLSGCTAAPHVSRAAAPAPAPNLNLVAFDSCAELGADLRAAAAPLVGPYGLADRNYGIQAPSAGGLRADARVPDPVPAFSSTNNHEAGADEPDIVKTDGRRIVTIGSDGVLRVVDATSRVRTGELKLAVSPLGEPQLLLSGDRALVLVPPGPGNYHPRPMPMDDGVQRPEYTGEPGNPEVILVDLAGAPTVTSRYTGEGMIVDARQTGSTARVVLKSSPRIAFPPLPDVNDDAKRTTANRKVLEAAPTADWLPNWQVTTGATTTEGHVGCDRVNRPAVFSGTSMLTVLSFDLRAPALTDGDPISVLADGDVVYGTPTSLYITNDQRWQRRLPRQVVPDRTQIFRFDITGRPSFVADGTVPGTAINQYALSEWDGHLRIATIDGATLKTSVRVLRQEGGKLMQTGVVGGLGKGEQIFAVRFLGPRGYVVTFKQTDPLYSLDLSDPAKPVVTGSLKITGNSSHLQPVDTDRLIGIGADASVQGTVLGAQISLFDVSNPAAPRQLARQRVPGTDSGAAFDPHALLWWPATKLLVVPLTVWDPQQAGQQNAAMALRVTGNRLERLAMVTQPVNRHPRAGQERFPSIERSFVVGDVLWTLSTDGLQASDLSTLHPLSWLPS